MVKGNMAEVLGNKAAITLPSAEFLLRQRPLPLSRLTQPLKDKDIIHYDTITVIGYDQISAAGIISSFFETAVQYIETGDINNFFHIGGTASIDLLSTVNISHWYPNGLQPKGKTLVFIIGTIHSLLSDDQFNKMMDLYASPHCTAQVDFIVLDYFFGSGQSGVSELNKAQSVLSYNSLRPDIAIKAFFSVYEFNWIDELNLTPELIHQLVHSLPLLNTLPHNNAAPFKYRQQKSPKFHAAALYSLMECLRSDQLVVKQIRFGAFN